MTVRIYNTATRTKEEFLPQDAPNVTMYNCGPTVYDYFHIGNARNFVTVDAIRRHLEYRKYRVKFVQNFTDVDDKMIKRANESGQTLAELGKTFIDAYFKSADALGVRRADVHPCATEHIPQQIALVEGLIEKGLAYEVNGNVYFRVRELKEYGSLSGKNIDDLQEGARVEVGEAKEDPIDFTLWKAAKRGEPSWDSPWGAGRPGWHLECSAMSMHHLGETIDIHSGGVDLIFPHHENEQAQSVGFTGKPFVKYWIHNGFLTIDKEKMSKSLGNFFTIDQVTEKYDPAIIRFYLLSAHYRHPLDYSGTALDEAASALNRVREALVTSEKLAGKGEAATDCDKCATALREFDEAMDDDFNTQRAFGILFELVAALNEEKKHLNAADAEPVRARVRAMGNQIRHLLDRLGMLELMFSNEKQNDGLEDQLVDLLIRSRQEAKKAKQFALADYIRDQMAEMGIRLQDHPTGTIWLKD